MLWNTEHGWATLNTSTYTCWIHEEHCLCRNKLVSSASSKRSCFLSAAQTFPSMVWVERSTLRFRPCSPTNSVAPSTSALQPFRGGYSCILHIRQSLVLQKRMFKTVSELWLDIGKTYCDIQVHTLYSDNGPLIHWIRLTHISTWCCTTPQLLGWVKIIP